MAMLLDEEQQKILDGSRGETMAKVMQTLVRYGEVFGAEKMVPSTSEYNHLVTSFGLGVMSSVYDLMDTLIDAGVVSKQKFSVDPRPMDKKHPIRCHYSGQWSTPGSCRTETPWCRNQGSIQSDQPISARQLLGWLRTL